MPMYRVRSEKQTLPSPSPRRGSTHRYHISNSHELSPTTRLRGPLLHSITSHPSCLGIEARSRPCRQTLTKQLAKPNLRVYSRTNLQRLPSSTRTPRTRRQPLHRHLLLQSIRVPLVQTIAMGIKANELHIRHSLLTSISTPPHRTQLLVMTEALPLTLLLLLQFPVSLPFSRVWAT